jgi:hypothetical protein
MKAIVTSCLLMISSLCQAQVMCDLQTFRLNKVAGTVVSNGPKGFEPINNAKVDLLRIGSLGENDLLVASTTSDAQGFFRLRGMKPGRYRLEVSKRDGGFLRFSAGIIVVKRTTPEDARQLRIRLGVAPLEKEGCGDAVFVNAH